MEENVLEINCIDHLYLGVTPLKEKSIYEIKMMMQNNPLTCGMIKYFSCGIVTFDDERHDVWKIELRPEFKKNKTNVIIFEVDTSDVKSNPYGYNYIIVYNNVTKIDSSFNYFWYKEDENKILSRVSLDEISDKVISSIVRDINSFKVHKLYNTINKGLNIVEYEKIYKEYIETYRAYSYDEYVTNTFCNLRWKI